MRQFFVLALMLCAGALVTWATASALEQYAAARYQLSRAWFQMKRITGGGPKFLRSDTGKGLSKTQAEINGCLFVALVPDHPLVLPDMEREDALATYLEWTGGKNFYAGFAQMGMWKERYSEPSPSVYEAARLMLPKLDEDPTQKLQALWDITPEMLKLADADIKRLTGFGVPTELVEQRWMPAPPKTDDE